MKGSRIEPIEKAREEYKQLLKRVGRKLLYTINICRHKVEQSSSIWHSF